MRFSHPPCSRPRISTRTSRWNRQREKRNRHRKTTRRNQKYRKKMDKLIRMGTYTKTTPKIMTLIILRKTLLLTTHSMTKQSISIFTRQRDPRSLKSLQKPTSPLRMMSIRPLTVTSHRRNQTVTETPRSPRSRAPLRR